MAPLAVVGIAIWAKTCCCQTSGLIYNSSTTVFLVIGIASRLNWLYPMDHSSAVFGIYRLGMCVLASLLISSFLLFATLMRWLIRHGWPMAVIMPSTWLAWETALHFILDNAFCVSFDPLRLAITQSKFPLSQLAGVGGMALVTWATAASSGLLVDCVRAFVDKESNGISASISGFALFILLVYCLDSPSDNQEHQRILVELIPETYSSSQMKSLHDTTMRNRVDLTVWAESSVSETLGIDQDIEQKLFDIARDRGRPIIIGANRYDFVFSSLFNSVILIRPDTHIIQTADKRYLVPLSERMPPWANWFGLPSPFLQTARASSVQLLSLVDGTRIGTGVCHDVCFSNWACRVMEQDPDFLIQIASEQFSTSESIKYQMLAVAHFRAIESRRTLVRCVRQGYSAVIDANGKIIEQSIDWRNADPLIVDVPIMRGFSLYHQIGEIIPWSLVAIGCIVAEWESRRVKKRSQTRQSILSPKVIS